jgi:putative DNA primase/helicase
MWAEAIPNLCAAVRFANQLESEPLHWLWPDRIPLGKLTLLIGDPGAGKSLLAADLAARVSAGLPLPVAADPRVGRPVAAGAPPAVDAPATPTPTKAPTPAGVILVCPEDAPADTLLPRLTAAGADSNLICFLDGATDTYAPSALSNPACLRAEAGPPRRVPSCLPLIFPAHLPILAQAVRAVTWPQLVVLDPLHTLLSPAAQSSTAALNETLAGLADLAHTYQVAILAVGHLSKSYARRMLYRVRGSLNLVAAARSVLLLTADPDHPDRRILSAIKSVYGPPPDPLAFRIVPAASRISNLKSPSSPHAAAPNLHWEPSSSPPSANPSIPAPDLLDLSAESQSALTEACNWLIHFLSAGPRPAREVIRAARSVGISLRTLERAKRLLAVRSLKADADSTWLWSRDQRLDNDDRQLGGTKK